MAESPEIEKEKHLGEKEKGEDPGDDGMLDSNEQERNDLVDMPMNQDGGLQSHEGPMDEEADPPESEDGMPADSKNEEPRDSGSASEGPSQKVSADM